MRFPPRSHASNKLSNSSMKADMDSTINGWGEDDLRSSTDSLSSLLANSSELTGDYSFMQESDTYRFETIRKAAVICLFLLFMMDPKGSVDLALTILLFAPYPAWIQRWIILIPLLLPMPPFEKLKVVVCLSMIQLAELRALMRTSRSQISHNGQWKDWIRLVGGASRPGIVPDVANGMVRWMDGISSL